jgi:arylsulfatase A-like enzyme
LRVPLIVRGPGLASRRVVDAPFVNADWLPTLLELTATPVPGELDGVNQATLLRTGKGSGQARTLYWHLPHYTNQGSRPAGAVREGDWKLVEHYDDDHVQLFNLANDIGESRDLASAEPARAAALREKLRAWRKSVDAQENRPNSAVNHNMYNALYATFDPTRFDPLRANDVEWQKVAEWRKLMNAAVAKPVQ